MNSRKTKSLNVPTKCDYNKIILLLILILSAALSFAFYFGPDATAGEDNYFYSYAANLLVTQGLKSLMSWGTGGLKYIVIGGTAFFYKMLGPSNFSTALFAILCLLGVIVTVYLIGSRLHSKRAGLLAALLFAVLPIAVSQASSAGDDIPMTFLTTLAMLFFVLALDKNGDKRLCFISGFLGLSSFFASPEGLLIFLPIFAALAYLTLKERKRERVIEIGLVLAGCLFAFLLFTLIAYMETGNLLHIINTETTSYSAICAPIPGASCNAPTLDGFNFYLSTLFPYHIRANIGELLNNQITFSKFMSKITNPSYGNLDNDFDFDYYSYLAIISVILLIAFRDKRGSLLVLWIFLTFLYLSFGTASISHYERMSLMYPRYTIIFFPAVTLLIAFGLMDLLDAVDSRYHKGREKLKKYLFYLAVGSVVFLLVSYSILMIRDMNYSWYRSLYNIITVAQFINTLPPNASILGNNWAAPVEQYTTYEYNFSHYEMNATNCINIPSNSYIFAPYNLSLEEKCGLKLALLPSTVPAWLSGYNLYMPIMPNYSSISVYFKS
ncbi:MAG: glycosyltransferase family 39 protein [Candidatus Micrarchaeales archaeon]|jgi:4-amino-4-deoxy-L-arabinose transferase-like glycosyltransferase